MGVGRLLGLFCPLLDHTEIAVSHSYSFNLAPASPVPAFPLSALLSDVSSLSNA